MLENVKKNLVQWEEKHGWAKDGDEWDGQAKLCGLPYEEWKSSLVQHLIRPRVTSETKALEIAPGHGRWTEYLSDFSSHVTVVDISNKCLEFCRRRFQLKQNIDYFLTTGTQLPPDLDNMIDFVWSYDSFVHMDAEVISSYLREIRRVLKVGGQAIIHHANVDDPATHKQGSSPGWRSPINAEIIRRLSAESGMFVASQFTYWDERRRVGAPRFNDRISHLIKHG